MNVGWLIDGDMFPSYRNELVAAIESQGHVAKLIHAPSPPFRWDDVGCSYRETFPVDHCVVAHGDIELVSRIVGENRWIPGGFATIENFFVSSYLNHYREFWLNRDCTMLPFCELEKQKHFLFDSLGKDGQIFVRPDSPLKIFTGQVVRADSFRADVDYMGFYEFPKESMVIVSSPKQVIREWRFVVCQRQVVAGCLYAEAGRFNSSPAIDKTAQDLAMQITSLAYQPDPVWIIDICETGDGLFHLLEIGGFSFSDLYECNKLDIVKAVSETAKLIWQKRC